MRCNPVELPRNSGNLGIPTMKPQQTVNDSGKSSFIFCCLRDKWLKRRALEPLLLFMMSQGAQTSQRSLCLLRHPAWQLASPLCPSQNHVAGSTKYQF